MLPNDPTKINVSQAHVLANLGKYIEQYHSSQAAEKLAILKALPVGYCNGMDILWLYSKWLSYQPKTQNPRDDIAWFNATRKLIATWDGQSPLSEAAQKDFFLFLSYIDSFQRIDSFFKAAQGDLHTFLSDDLNREFTKEYAIAFSGSKEQLETVLAELLVKNKMILFTSSDHDIAQFRKSAKYFFYDSNDTDGEMTYDSPAEIAEAVFDAYYFNKMGAGTVGIRVFNPPGEIKTTFPDVKTLLDKIYAVRISPSQSTSSAMTEAMPLLSAPDKNKKEYPALMMAIRVNSLESARYFLDHGANPNQMQALGLAAIKGNREMIELLLERGADPNSSFNQQSALTHAAYFGDPKIITLLIKSGANVSTERADGMTALDVAATRGYTKAVLALLANGAAIDHQDKEGETALMHAAREGNIATALTLIERGAQAFLVNHQGKTAADLALEMGHKELSQAIIDSVIVPLKTKISEKLIEAILQNQVAAVGIYLLHGADPNFPDEQGFTPLLAAIKQNNIPMVEMILLSKQVDVNQKNALTGLTPLMLAAIENNPIIIGMLIDAGANINEKNNEGKTALYYAAKNVNLPMLSLLLSYQQKIERNPQLALLSPSERGAQLMNELIKSVSRDENHDELRQVQLSFLILALKNNDIDGVKETLKFSKLLTPTNINNELIFLKYHLNTAITAQLKEWVAKEPLTAVKDNFSRYTQLLESVEKANSISELINAMEKQIKIKQESRSIFSHKKQDPLEASIAKVIERFKSMTDQKKFKPPTMGPSTST